MTDGLCGLESNTLDGTVLVPPLKVIWVGPGSSIERANWAGTLRCNFQRIPSLRP